GGLRGVARRVTARAATVAAAERRVYETLRQEALGGYEQHHQGQDHAHDLTGEVGEGDVEHRAAVLQDAEEQRGKQYAERMVAGKQGDSDTVEAVVGGDRLTQRVVVERAAKHVVSGRQARHATAYSQR